ncbi:MAG: DUF342 domain-containing protein [Deferribacterales bacterium]|nr:DUF342 domain-containing protein [Deferribacterales bacterium]
MILTAFGDAQRIDLDIAARNVYTLLPEEYTVVSDSEQDGVYVLDINTLRRFDPIVKASVAPDRSSAKVYLYPGINSPRVLSDEEITEILVERYHFDPMYIKQDVLSEYADHYRQGFIVEKIPAVESVPVIDGKDAVIQILFERPNHKPKLLKNGKADYKSFTKFIMVKEGDLLIKRTPPTSGSKGFDVTGSEILPIQGKDVLYDALDGVSVNDNKTEYRAKHSGHVLLSGTMISVLPLLNINGNVDYRTGNINFEGAVHVSRDVLTGFSINADDIIVEGIDEDAILTARNVVHIKTGIKGLGSKGFVKAGVDVLAGYAENAKITAKNSIEIKKYCFNSILAADKILATTKNSIVTGGILHGFSLVHLQNAGSKGTNDMLITVGTSQEMEERSHNIRAELTQFGETLKKIAGVLAQTDLRNPAVVKNPKVRKLIETANILKRKQPLLEAKLEETKHKTVHPDPRIIIEDTIRAGVKIKIYNDQIELKTDMTKVEFFFDKDTGGVGFQNYDPNKEELSEDF